MREDWLQLLLKFCIAISETSQIIGNNIILDSFIIAN